MSEAPDPQPVLSADAFTLQQRGGVSRYFAELHRGLREIGIDSTIESPLWLSRHHPRFSNSRKA